MDFCSTFLPDQASLPPLFGYGVHLNSALPALQQTTITLPQACLLNMVSPNNINNLVFKSDYDTNSINGGGMLYFDSLPYMQVSDHHSTPPTGFNVINEPILNAEPLGGTLYTSTTRAHADHDQQFPFEYASLLQLQSLLQTQYGIFLSLDQLLACDALPALLNIADAEHQETDEEGRDCHSSYHDDDQQGDRGQNCNMSHDQACDRHGLHEMKLHMNEHGPGSPGSDTYMNDQCHHVHRSTSAAICRHLNLYVGSADHESAIKFPNASSPECSAGDMSIATDEEHIKRRFFPRQLDYVYGSPNPYIFPASCCSSDEAERGLVQALDAMQRQEQQQPQHILTDDDICAPPPAQRRRLQGITLDQVLQAEKTMQQQQLEMVNATGLLMAHAAGAAGFTADELPEAASITFDVGDRDHEMNTGKDVVADNAAAGGYIGGLMINTRTPPAQHYGRKPISPAPATLTSSIEPQSIAARNRRKRIREKTVSLQQMIPGAARLDTASMYDLAIKYVHFLQAQMVCLENEASCFSTAQRRGPTAAAATNAAAVGAAFRRALMHRLLASQDVQHFLSREGLCLVSENLARMTQLHMVNVLTSSH